MRLVLDPEWDVCYIELTSEEHAILKADGERWLERTRRIPELLAGAWSPPPKDERMKELEEEGFKLAREARPFHNKIHRAVWPELTIYGIEARVAQP